MPRRISGKTWVSIVTIVILVLVIYFSRKEIVHAWQLFQQVNIWILLLIIPVQFLSYYAAGEMFLSYLRAKKVASTLSALSATRLSLEMTFVNHFLPSGGVSGASYIVWRLRHFGVSTSRATTSQLVRLVAMFSTYFIFLIFAVIMMTFDGALNRWVVGLSSAMVFGLIGVFIGLLYVLGYKSRFEKLSYWLARAINRTIKFFTFGRSPRTVQAASLIRFFEDIQEDYFQIRRNKSMLLVPLLWGVVFNMAEIAMFWLGFLALGYAINPAPLIIAYGLAGIAGFFMVTPGGAGAYEAIMVSFLTFAGINPQTSIAGIVLTRVLLLIGTIASGYIFYQQAIVKHGSKNTPVQR